MAHTEAPANGSTQLDPEMGQSIAIAPPDVFDFGECLAYLNRSNQELLHSADRASIAKLVRFHGVPTLIRVSIDAAGLLEVAVLNRRITPRLYPAVIAYVREWFDLDRSLDQFYKIAARDKVLGALIRQHYGLRLVRIPDLFHALCWAILGQQINLAFAYTLFARFIRTFGERVTFGEREYWLFPDPEKVAALAPSVLMELQMTRRKSEYLIGTAGLIATGKLSKTELLTGDDSAARAALIRVRGVGPWTANYVLMRCLGKQNAFPIEDVGLHNAIQKQLGTTRKPSLAEIRKLAKGWSGWQGYATFYLYRSLI